MKLTMGEKGEVYGIPHDLTMNGRFINVSLFKSRRRDSKGDKVTWKSGLKPR